MTQKYTLWNIPSESWAGVPEGLEVSADLAKAVDKVFSEPVDEDEVSPYRTPVDQDQMAKIIG